MDKELDDKITENFQLLCKLCEKNTQPQRIVSSTSNIIDNTIDKKVNYLNKTSDVVSDVSRKIEKTGEFIADPDKMLGISSVLSNVTGAFKKPRGNTLAHLITTGFLTISFLSLLLFLNEKDKRDEKE